MDIIEPLYVKAAEKGVLPERIKTARSILRECMLCPRQCRVSRIDGHVGFCNTGNRAWVSSYGPHFGEESPLVGKGGSGTIFFTHCNLGCNFCQNDDISHKGQGQPVSDHELARIMLSLQNTGCENINFVTPSHVVPQILSALTIAVDQGLSLPLIYNTGAYDRVETLKLLDGIVDIYMPDFKFWDPEVADMTCNAPDYPDAARSAIMEMHRQVGDLVVDGDKIARRGLLVRHLVMPGSLAGTRDVMRFLSRNISPNTYVNIMPQYRPCGRAGEVKALARPLSPSDFEKALADTKSEGINRLDERRRRFRIC